MSFAKNFVKDFGSRKALNLQLFIGHCSVATTCIDIAAKGLPLLHI